MPTEPLGATATGGFFDDTRAILRLSGPDARELLQGLVTNDVRRLGEGAPLYAALLSPQGKFLHDFLLVADGADVLLDTDAEGAEALARRLAMYRLRRDVTIADSGLGVALLPQGAAPPAGLLAVTDPREPALGLRVYAPASALDLPVDAAARAAHEALRVRLGVPATGAELRRDETFILEAGFERLHGVDFRKGCYVGQEVTARMKHKAELRRGLVRLAVEGTAPPPGAEISNADGKSVGTIGSVAGGEALALVRLDRATGEMRAGEAVLRRIEA
ncbi:folate-binding protein YgfZ [Oceanicella sp. SM1341]|uniref:CAF17-like 4Fe-4S cluster assembly/insertion protein YgfZ n=1 Tax=Oceanicella sp. SM1341 TaxID=1548889 RepID=UPI000E535974|nr:folate-binding protein YgfZ [Oceanicella sp. SM1341]